MNYSENFIKEVHADLRKRIDNADARTINIINAMSAAEKETFKQDLYSEYAQKPEFKKYLEQEQGYFSKVGDDLSNIGKAWNAGNFYSHGGWNDIAKNIINGGTPEDREKLFQNYLKWESQNQMPENKTIVGEVINGVANLVPLTVDMLPEAATVGAGTGAVGAVGGSIVPGIGTVAGGIGGFKAGATASMIEQSIKVGMADIYTSLREDGVSDEAALEVAKGWRAYAYGLAEYAGRAIAPVGRQFLGGKALKEIIDSIADKKIKNELANYVTKKGLDIAITGTAETAIEAGQASLVEDARQKAMGEERQWGNIAQAGWNEAKAVAPAMYGMAGLGIPIEATANRITNRTSDKKNVQDAIIEGRDFQPVPAGVKLGETFKGTDGKLYRNVDGYAMPVIEQGTEKDNLEEDAEKDDSFKQENEKPKVQLGEDGKLYATSDNEIKQVGNADFSGENAALYYQPFANHPSLQNLVFDREKQAELEQAEKRQAELEAQAEADMELEAKAKAFQQKQDAKARKSFNAQNRINAISKKIDRIDDVSVRLDAMELEYENGNIDKLTDNQLHEALEHGYSWAEAELNKRSLQDSQGITLLDVLKELRIKLPTPQAIIRDAQNKGYKNVSGYLYGEINDLYNSLPKDKKLRYFSKNHKDLDTVAEELAEYGFHYDSEADFISDVAENLSGRKVSTGYQFSLAKNDYSAMSDQELIEAHAKAEQVKDEKAGQAITDEWLKRKGYTTDTYHGSPKNDITEFKEESYFTKDKDYAKRYKRGENGKIYETKLNLKKPFDTRNPRERAIFENEFYRKWGNGAPLSERGLPDWTDGSDLLEFLDENGYDYDGIILDEGADGGYGEAVKQRGESYVPRSASQIKSRDAFTYGDDGKYIPLDKRGDINNPDIRFSIKEGDAQRLKSNSKAETIKREVLNLKSKFDKNAKHKSNVEIVGTVNEARENLGGSIPGNARGIQSGNRIILVAENLDDAETGARVFLHEQVGHFGLRGLLGKDLRPFLNYVIKHYKGTKAWNDIASKPDYAKQGDYAIAEEILAHLAENRELSDPSMWKRLSDPSMWKRIVHKVKRALWEKGVPQEYVNLLDEDVLRSAIVLSREWAKGDHYLNANGVWESVKNTRRAKDVPEDENFSLNDSETQKQYDEVVAKYKGTEQWMKAPNGKPTNLTERQWVMVRTQNFKNWFGDWENDPKNASKVVDENGEPLVVYHGTNSIFTKFKRSKKGYLGAGIYLSDSKNIAKRYTDYGDDGIMSVFVNAKNPLIIKGRASDVGKAILEVLGKEKLYQKRIERTNMLVDVVTSSDIKALQKLGYDSIVWEVGSTTEYLAFEPNQIKSATDNIGTFDDANDDIRFSLVENSNNLVVLHNITTDKLKYANRMGGLPVPSLAVSRVEYPVKDFGDILLIAPKGILNELSAKTFNADVYSPRQPRAKVEVSRKEKRRVESEILKRAKENGIIEKYAYLDFSEEDAETALVKNRIIQQLYEKETGNDFDGYWDLRESEWFKGLMKDLDIQITEKLFKGRRYDGSPLYAPYTLENVARLMKRNGIRGGENFNYGVGSIRAYVARELKNSSVVQSQRNKIVSTEDMKDIKKQTEETFNKLLSNAVENLKSGGKYFGATDEVYESIVEAIKTRNWESVMRRDFKDGFDYTPLKNFVESLADLPTEYFETKLQRIMRLNEFVGAIIPSYADEDIRNILDENGIPYKEYKGKDMSTALDEFTSELNKEYEDIRFSIKEEISRRTFTQSEEKSLKAFDRDVDLFESGKLPVHKLLEIESENDELDKIGIPKGKIVFTQKVIRDAMTHGIDVKEMAREILDPISVDRVISQGIKTERFDVLVNQVGKQNRFVVPVLKINVSRKNINSTVEAINVLGFDETEVFERFNETSPYWNTRRGQSFTQSIQSRLSDNEMSEIDLNLDLVSKYQRESQDENLEKVLAQIDIDLLNSKLSKGLLFKEKITRALNYLNIGYWAKSRPNESSQYLKLKLPNGNSIDVRASDHPQKYRADISVERNWKSAIRFIVDQNKEDTWGTKNSDYWSGNARLRFSLGDEEELSEQEKAKLYKQKRVRELITSKAGRAVQATLDAFSALASLERVVRGKIQDASKSAWKMALMTRNLDQVMFHLLNVGNIEYDKATGTFKAREGTIGLKKILDPIKRNYKNFQNYALAKCALQRWAILRKQNFYTEKTFQETFGFSEEDARKWVKEGNEATQKAFRQLQGFFQAQRKFMLETGLISEDRYNALSRFTNYVPFFRMGEDLDAEAQETFDKATELNPGGRGFSGRDSGIKTFEGSARQTKDLIENIINQARSVMDAGYKNIAMYRSLNLMREIGLADYIKQDSEEARATLGEMKKRLEEQGFNVSEMSDEDIMRKNPIEVFYDVSATDEREQKDIVAVRVNGGLRFYRVNDKELLVAIKNFGGEKFNVAWKLLTIPKNIMTSAITKLPEFAIRNFIRDTGSNTILFGGKNVPGYIAKTIANIGQVAFNDAFMKKQWASGAGGGTWYSVKAEDFASDFKGDAWSKTKRVGKYVVRPATWFLQQYERRVLMPSEQANRATVMKQALNNGASDMEAAFQAMDVLNFGMRGSGVWTGDNEWAKATAKIFQAIVRITPFLNARLQGLYKIWRESGASDGAYSQSEQFGLANRTKAFVQKVSKGILMRATMLAGTAVLYSIYANSSEDDDGEKWYEKLSSEDKLNYWHFYLGENTIVRIPKPFEIGLMFATVPETMVNALIQNRPDTLEVLKKGLFNTLEFDPMANPVLDTIREQISNKDSFTGRPIVQQSDRELSPKHQYDASTSASAKAIAKVFSGLGLSDTWLASPARVQNAIGNMLAGMTKYITAASDPIIESITDIEGGTSRYARESILRQPFAWATRNTKTMNTRNNTDFYDLRARCRELYASARLLRQEGRMQEVQDFIDQHKGELGNYKFVEAVNTRLNEISRKRKALGASKALSNSEIIAKDDELLMERNRILSYVDVLMDRIDNGKFEARHFREILKRIENAGKDKKDSRNTRMLLRELSDMR